MVVVPDFLTLPLSGVEVRIKNVRQREFRDVPEILPLYSLVIDRLGTISGDERQKTMTDARQRQTIRDLEARESYVEAILLARAVDPPIWSEDELGPMPEGALPISDFPEADLVLLQQAIVNRLSGMDRVTARLEAERLARFCDGPNGGGDAAPGDGGGEAERDEAERAVGGDGPGRGAGVGSGVGDDRAEGGDA